MKVWANAIKSKERVFEMFEKIYADVEREIGRKLKYIHTDNGENTSRILSVISKI